LRLAFKSFNLNRAGSGAADLSMTQGLKIFDARIVSTIINTIKAHKENQQQHKKNNTLYCLTQAKSDHTILHTDKSRLNLEIQPYQYQNSSSEKPNSTTEY